jgi:hypothetical protein
MSTPITPSDRENQAGTEPESSRGKKRNRKLGLLLLAIGLLNMYVLFFMQ